MFSNHLTPKIYRRLVPALICLVASFSFAGCSKEDMDEMVSKAKDSATEFKDKSGDVLKKAKDSAGDAASQLKEKSAELKEKTSGAISNVKEQAANITQGAGNMLSMNGSAEISLDKPTKFPASYVRVVPLAPGQSVVQLKSYSTDGQSTTFPAFFIQGNADVSANSLAGKTIPCQLYAQTSADGAVWKNVPGELIQVKFNATDNGLTAIFSSANLVNLETNTISQSSGSFVCADMN